MRRFPAATVLVWLCLLLQLGGTGVAFGTVLCVASDGHVALEVAHPGSCVTETRRHHDEGVAHDADHAALDGLCGSHPCTDIVLGGTPCRSLLRSGDALVAPHAVTTCVLPAATDAVAIRAAIGEGLPLRPDARLHDRRTIVLRN